MLHLVPKAGRSCGLKMVEALQMQWKKNRSSNRSQRPASRNVAGLGCCWLLSSQGEHGSGVVKDLLDRLKAEHWSHTLDTLKIS